MIAFFLRSEPCTGVSPSAVRGNRFALVFPLLGSLVMLAIFPPRGLAQDGEGTPALTLTPGAIPADAEAAYNAARTPQATVTLGDAAETNPQVSATKGPSTAVGTLPGKAALSAAGGVFPAVSLAFSGGAPAGKGTKAGTSTSSGPAGGVPPANVTLQFDPARAGTLVWVQMLDGGNLSALDADGGRTDAQGGFFMEIGAAGTVAFTYQAPGIGGHYQVVARLDNVSTVLPFDVPDASGN